MAAKVRYRPEQRKIIEGYTGGKMGIAAVPGSGKTFTLSQLAARLVEQLAAQGLTNSIDRQEVLVVTFTNTAVNSFRSRIAETLQRERGLLPYVGYRVRTLHGLAHDIVRERPSLVGLAEDFQIVDERVSVQIIRDITHSLLGEYQHIFAGYLNPETVGTERQQRRVERTDIPQLAAQLGLQFIKNAKNNVYDPEALKTQLAQSDQTLPLAEFGIAVYEDYQRSLSYRGAVDFDDLVRLAIVSLQRDSEYCDRLRKRWPYILEDEAQDSSKLQEDMLSLLSNDQNWVRVGDPNQAINTTFTTADPRFLRAFLQRDDVRDLPLQTSGRSAKPIIDLANTLVDWTTEACPVPTLRETFLPQQIKPTRKNDPQPNPQVEANSLYIHYRPSENVTPEQELELVATNIQRFLEKESDHTIAVLAPENSRGYKLTELLRDRDLPYEELLRSTTATREAASMMRWVLAYLSSPLNAKFLARLYGEVWIRTGFAQLSEDDERRAIGVRALSGCRRVEEYLWPAAGLDWLAGVDAVRDDPELLADLVAFRERVQVWLKATTLPIDQIVLTLTQDLFADPADIALGHKIAVVLRGISRSNPTWRLTEFVEELRQISENQRKFIGFDDVEQGYEPQPGQVTVATMHAAKGLEWDRVYLLGVSNYGFPLAQPYDNYIAERWFVRDDLNLEAETMAQLQSLMDGRDYVEGSASQRARIEYAAERLRLLYVGITRAKRNLMITWNMGRFWQRGDQFMNRPALPLVALWDSLQ
jgi:DNA helicase-2/ATP-dependent DNA helicase PcrA